VFTLINTALGATVHLHDGFDPAETLRRMSALPIHNVFMVPTMIQRLLELPLELFESHPTPALRAIISGAAPFGDALRRKAIERFGAGRVFDFYGATELGWVTLVDGHEMLQRPGTLGRAIPGQELAIFDDDGKAVASGTVGRIYTRSAQRMEGYMRDEQANQEIRRGEWLTVDDLGWMDEDGYLYLTGRARDMVISGGVNIYPAEIENVLAAHPEIVEIAVIGVPDERWGERLVAVVTPREKFDPDQVMAWARQRLTAYKVPRQWECVEALPRNPTGKVLKRELAQTFA
jgi:acyl-CoA synthetase (AMP-forming)/AMP-acid ligase II